MKKIFLVMLFGLFLISLSSASVSVTLNYPTDTSTVYSNPITFNASASTTSGSLTNISLCTNISGIFNCGDTSTFSSDTSNILSWWKLDENSGTVIDSLGINNGTNSGATAGVSGKIGTAYSFNRNGNNYINLGNSASLEHSYTGQRTIMAWIKMNSLGNGVNYSTIISKENPGSPYAGWYFRVNHQNQLEYGYMSNYQTSNINNVTNDAVISNTGQWYFVAVVYNNKNIYLYVNGTLMPSTSSINNIQASASTSSRATIGAGSNATTQFFDGTIDELSVWDRVLNSTEIMQYYNNGAGSRYSINNINQSWLKTIPLGTTKWNIQACDNAGACTFATSNYTTFLYSTPPMISILSPASTINYSTDGFTYPLNFTATTGNINGLSSCWYNYNGTNTTVSCTSGVQSNNLFNIASASKSLTVYANDTAGNLASQTVNWDYKVFENSRSYNTTTISTSSESFITNLTYVSSDWLFASANLYYNGTVYSSTKTQTTNNLIFSNTLNVPNALTTTKYNFYWNISLQNSTGTYYIISDTSNQTVNPIQNISVSSSCSAGFSPAFNFSFFDESNLSSINASSVSYNFKYGIGQTNALTAYGTLSNINNFVICINSSASYYIGYGEIDYSLSGYSNRKFYIFNNTRMTNTTISNNLYLLDTASSTPFQVTSESTSLTPYINYYISLLRWYPNLNQYNVVEMGKTDDSGKTVLNVKTNDVDYRVGLYDNDGTLIKLLNPVRMVCQTTPCTYDIITSGANIDLTSFLNIQQNLSFDPTTKTYTFIWNDPSQNTKSMNLLVFKDSGTSPSVVICNQTASGFTGILVCDVSAYSGLLRAEAWRTAYPPNLIAQLSNELRQTFSDLDTSHIGLFFGFLIVITFALLGTASPVLVVILSMISLIPIVILGNISFAILMIIGGIGGLILHILKRTGQ